MRDGLRDDITARLFLTLGALLPYWRLLTFGVIYVTDDVFASDIFNGELPGRVLVGQLIRHGQAPVWTNQLCSGISLGGTAADPIGLAAFSLLSPAAALDLLVIVLLLVAAHGAYGLARRFGASRPGAVLAGIAFAGSGYVACQLKHLSIVSTVVWLPVGLGLIDRAMAPSPASDIPVRSRAAAPQPAPTLAGRALPMAAFGLVFANQVLSGFPQSAYICGLVYGAFALFRAFTNRQRLGRVRLSLVLLAGLSVAVVLGAAGGAVVILPLSELGSVSDRATGLGWAWATRLAYWPPNVLTFLMPYMYGDISNDTYRGRSLFWEDYGYVGLATFLLALYAASGRQRRPPMLWFAIGMTLVAYLIVLGPATPVFRLVYELVPGMKLFRFPTRFLIVVELGLSVLGGIGLTRFCATLEQRFSAESPRAPRLIVLALCVGTAVDLFVHQPRQNPMVGAKEWLSPPGSVATIRAGTTQPRTYTPGHRGLHSRDFTLAHGWANVQPYFQLRDVLQPNIGGGYWDIPSADCYAGIAPRWYVNTWGDHNRQGLLVAGLARLDSEEQAVQVDPAMPRILKIYGVTHVLSASALSESTLPFVSRAGTAYIYRVDGAARVRYVRAARVVKTDEEAAARLLEKGFDPDREILLQDAPESVARSANEDRGGAPQGTAGRAVVTHEDSRHIVIEAEVPEDGFLLLADTFYPGWRAEVDGKPTPVYRANISVRGIQVPKGRHDVRFTYDAPAFFRGLRITVLAISTLLLWLLAAACLDWRARR